MNTNRLSTIHLSGIIILSLTIIPVISTYAEEVLDAAAANALMTDQGTNVVIPDNYTSIANQAFIRTDLTSVIIPNSITCIGRQSFLECDSLASVTIIGNSVETIDYQAFRGCSNLTSVVIPDSVTTIGTDAFAAARLTSVMVIVSEEEADYLDFSSGFEDDVTLNMIGPNSDLTGADLRGADLANATLRDALYDENTQFPTDFDPQSAAINSKAEKLKTDIIKLKNGQKNTRNYYRNDRRRFNDCNH
mgnify:CR=1 FL=1